MNNALQKAILRFFIGSFFIALLCTVIISEFVGEAFFLFLFHLYLGGLQHLSFLLPGKKQVTIMGGIYW